MTPLYVQIKCELGQAYAVADAIIDRLEELSEVYSTSGSWDLLAKFYIPEGMSIGGFINDRLHKIEGIRDTHTILAFRLHGATDGVRMDEAGR